MTHTPGPWTFTKFERAAEGCKVGLFGYQVKGRSPEHGSVVIAEAYPQPWLVAINEHNARLMAAAPTMKEALEQIAARLGATGGPHKGEIAEALEFARFAIAQAEG